MSNDPPAWLDLRKYKGAEHLKAAEWARQLLLRRMYDRGAWWAVIHYKGKRKWKKLGADKREAQKIVNKLNAKLAREALALDEKPPRKVSVEEALLDWYRDYRLTFSRAFAQLAEINIRRHLVPAFGSMALCEIREAHLLRFVEAKLEGD